MPIELTRREREILAEIAAGATDDQIAKSLDLNVNTVRIHIKLICRVIKAENRIQAALWALENWDLIEGENKSADIYRHLNN